MFDLFGKADYKLPKPEPLWKSGPKSSSTNTYKVGVTRDGKTTLTLVRNSTSMTLTMDQPTCKQLIRLLQATLTEDGENEDANT